jgi:uncharacterized transporter YbjL
MLKSIFFASMVLLLLMVVILPWVFSAVGSLSLKLASVVVLGLVVSYVCSKKRKKLKRARPKLRY